FPIADDETAERWDAWRRDQVSRYLPEIKSRLRAGQKLSVAALAYADRAYLSAFQDWRGWLADGAVDRVCLMSYSPDDRLFGHLVRQAAACCEADRSRLYAGVGMWFFDDA